MTEKLPDIPKSYSPDDFTGIYLKLQVKFPPFVDEKKRYLPLILAGYGIDEITKLFYKLGYKLTKLESGGESNGNTKC